ncbi:LANO_0H16402g1_1 [Lachancea nothofagi CBS 11611]|uniref:LANO_0H16402g1_1 n=1 Tax=Lachancea nothofagi CBS 11611 TaxID=1266666 RepID=A0A1G4KMV8_9SACH|nr:LANO_0H16402g1_1 [Lachancea nothofagi CBS 11611]
MPPWSFGYAPVEQDDQEELNESGIVGTESSNEAEIPQNPPEYQEGEDEGVASTMVPFEFEETDSSNKVGKVEQLKQNFKQYVVTPVRERVADPLAMLISMASHKVDYYLSKVGNPLILRRFVYVLFISAFIYYVSSSGLMPNARTSGSRGMFSDKEQLMSYAKRALDLSKMEKDLEFLSSMPHMAGTSGDLALAQYIMEAFDNNGLREASYGGFESYLNYPGKSNLIAHSSQGQSLELNLTDENFNPLSAKGEIIGAQLMYAHFGSQEDFQLLADNDLINEKTIVLLRYDSNPGEQVYRAQDFGFKGVIFISDGYGESEIDSIQQMSVHNFRYSMGDPLTPGWSAFLGAKITIDESPIIPKIPSIPISRRQAENLRGLFSNDQGVQFDDGWYSGGAGDVTVDFLLSPVERSEHITWNAVGIIEGREQNDKGIVICSARDSSCTGCTYPNYGTAALLSLAQLFQQAKYKYDWKPLRNIHFMSYDASEFGHAGVTELLEAQLPKFQNEIYSVVDISQLGIDPDSQKLDIQTNPLLFELFKDEELKMGFETDVRNVQQFGDWSAYLAKNIPVTIISAPHILERKYPIYTCDDTFERLLEVAGDDYWERSSELILYVFQMTLKLIDEPMIPFDFKYFSSELFHLLQDLEQSADGMNLDVQPLVESLDLWTIVGKHASSWVEAWNNIVMVENEGLEPSLLSVNRWSWNKKIGEVLRSMKVTGIPQRPFYTNGIFGPTLKDQTPYDSWSFPSIRDAIKDHDQALAQKEIDHIASLLKEGAHMFVESSEVRK